ncbi:hypothetical protein BJX99DRAFT_237372 [Aspergillus californicus]
MAPRPVQFIVNPTSSDESQQRLARSHAARSAHARARRLRTIQYQAQRRQEGEDRRHERVSETGLLSFLSAHRRDPFASCAKPLRAIEQRLFDHYVTVIIPHMRCSGLDVHFVERMNQYWVPLAITKTTLLDVMFLGACRQLSDFYHGQPEQQHYTRLAVQYKLQILQGLRQAISVETPQFSDSTIITTIMLAHDEVRSHRTRRCKR